MLRILDRESCIREAQQQFIKCLKSLTDEVIPVTLGYSGGHEQREISWIGKFGIWVASNKVSGSRYWNGFGIGKPKKESMIPIVCEINFPLKGIDRRIGGAFIKDNTGAVSVIHRGKIGGGKKGIGKSLFIDNYTGEWKTVKDGKMESKVALVGAINSPRFVRQISHYVFEVERIKRQASSSARQTAFPVDADRFKEEYSGKKQYKIKMEIEAECDHGLIVNDLSSTLERLGMRPMNNRNIDLYVPNRNGKITSIFEVKTNTSLTSLYSAVGQLLLNSAGIVKRPQLILTIPEQPNQTVKDNLNKLGIKILLFRWRGDKAIFSGLELWKL